MNNSMLIDRPAQLREGQTIVNFLDWLRQTKSIQDIFYTTDDLLAEYYYEFLCELEPNRKTNNE